MNNKMIKKGILITGASGFVGRHLINELTASKELFNIYALVRETTNFPSYVKEIRCSDITNIENAEIPWTEIEIVIHLAARAHVLKEKNEDPLIEFRRINRDATLNIARISAEHNVQRFVFLSSIGVIGNSSGLGSFSESTPEKPAAYYAISKLEAEKSLQELCQNTSMEFSIIRPPLVIGKDAPGNFNLLTKLILKKVPIPLSRANNRRSFIFCKNLAAFIVTCATHQNARNQIFVIADEPILSTPELIRRLSTGLKTKCYLFPMPIWLLKIFLTLLSKKSIYTQLCESLEVDSSKAKSMLDWEAPHSLKKALETMSDY